MRIFPRPHLASIFEPLVLVAEMYLVWIACIVVCFLFFKVGLPCTAGRVGVKILTLASNASGFLNYFQRVKGSEARWNSSRSLGPPNAPPVTAIAMPNKASKERERNRSRKVMRPPFHLQWQFQIGFFQYVRFARKLGDPIARPPPSCHQCL